ncbi:alpha/beta-hydrolase [Gloeopeniophorella convolvens]|nr:alpha/beta-hydrolase [Gloeopeniophorella convolvens]
MARLNHPDNVPIPPLTLRQRLWILPIFMKLPFAVAVGVFRENKGRSWSRAANLAALRHLFNYDWDMKMLQSFLGVTTSQVYLEWTRKEKQQVLTDVLPEGGKLHWIGSRRDSPNDRILLFFHGGAFSMPARPDYFPFLRNVQEKASVSLGDVGVAMLEYSLVPDAPFPTQLRQANAALTYLLQKGIPASNIVIGGDSAGANLVLQLASHILHPLPSLAAPPQLEQPFAGAVLISPWTLYSTDAPSYSRNEGKDMIFSRGYTVLSASARKAVTPELRNHLEPSVAPKDWWQGLDDFFPRVLVTAGEHECLYDDIMQLSSTISKHVKETTTVVEPGGVHEDAIVKFATDEGGSGKDYDAIVAFVTASFKGAV